MFLPQEWRRAAPCSDDSWRSTLNYICKIFLPFSWMASWHNLEGVFQFWIRCCDSRVFCGFNSFLDLGLGLNLVLGKGFTDSLTLTFYCKILMFSLFLLVFSYLVYSLLRLVFFYVFSILFLIISFMKSLNFTSSLIVLLKRFSV